MRESKDAPLRAVGGERVGDGQKESVSKMGRRGGKERRGSRTVCAWERGGVMASPTHAVSVCIQVGRGACEGKESGLRGAGHAQRKRGRGVKALRKKRGGWCPARVLPSFLLTAQGIFTYTKQEHEV